MDSRCEWTTELRVSPHVERTIGRVSAVDMRGKVAVTASNYERERERERYDEIILA